MWPFWLNTKARTNDTRVMNFTVYIESLMCIVNILFVFSPRWRDRKEGFLILFNYMAITALRKCLSPRQWGRKYHECYQGFHWLHNHAFSLFSTTLELAKDPIIKYSFTIRVILALLKGLNPWQRDHLFHNFWIVFMNIITIH